MKQFQRCRRSHFSKARATRPYQLRPLIKPSIVWKATIHLLFVDLGIHGDPEAGLKLASMGVEKRPELKVLYTSGQGVTDGMIALFVAIRPICQAIYNGSTYESATRQLQLEAKLATCSGANRLSAYLKGQC